MKQILKILSKTILPCLLVHSCVNGKKVITGDLYYTWLKMGSLYNTSEGDKKEMHDFMDTAQFEKLSGAEKLRFTGFKTLLENGLEESPFVYLRISPTKVIILYLNNIDYQQFKRIKYADLIKNNQKVKIRAKAAKLLEKTYEGNKILMYKCDQVISVKRTKGKTYERSKRGSKISKIDWFEDYL